MKKILVILIIAALLFTIPAVGAKGSDDSGNKGNTGGNTVQAVGAGQSANQSAGSAISQANKNESAGQGVGISGNLTYTYNNQEAIKNRIRLIQNESLNLSGSGTKNQNTVRVAVQALVEAGNISGGTGEQISAIAKEFNNSVTAQYNAEEKIRNRDALSRFFFGGDSDAAKEIQQQFEQNRVRIENLNTLMNECNCDDELKAMIREQIQVLEEEQNRLQELAQAELGDKGLFGGFLG
jgi:hypothetical protein